jgi:hypothetical protein
MICLYTWFASSPGTAGYDCALSEGCVRCHSNNDNGTASSSAACMSTTHLPSLSNPEPQQLLTHVCVPLTAELHGPVDRIVCCRLLNAHHS